MRIQEGTEALGEGVARPGSHRDLRRAWGVGQPTRLVGSAQFPDVVIVAGGEDLDQTGFICASTLPKAQQTAGLLRSLTGTQERAGAVPLPCSPGYKFQQQKSQSPWCCCPSGSSHAIFRSPR